MTSASRPSMPSMPRAGRSPMGAAVGAGFPATSAPPSASSCGRPTMPARPRSESWPIQVMRVGPSRTATKGYASTAARIGVTAIARRKGHPAPSVVWSGARHALWRLHIDKTANSASTDTPKCGGSAFGTSIIASRYGRSRICRRSSGLNSSSFKISSRAASVPCFQDQGRSGRARALRPARRDAFT